ncbi:MAG TPA: transglycosylase SLT domain-containing protein [Blastocatellia bacterium]|nr:transglycosylase SLT domain-containing protein [Blastocatellia bacterium]
MAEIVKPPVRVIISLTLIIIAVMLAAAFVKRMGRGQERSNGRATAGYERIETVPPASDKKNVVASNANPEPQKPASLPAPQRERKLYLRMSEEERNEFIYTQARVISRMMSNREYVFTDDVLPYIKKYVDGYARRVGNNSTAIWGEDLNSLFARARRLAPDIIREFNARGTPKIVGLYIPMIESEYRECLTSPVGAKGLFQFMPATASGYGVDPAERCNVKKMAPAAAKYIKDRMAEFGSDSMSVALGIAGYNRSPDSVRRDLSDVINSKNKERSFWTLIANSDKLDRFFQNENIKYVPKFFAAAIVGENPWAFGLEMNPLSTYTGSQGDQ